MTNHYYSQIPTCCTKLCCISNSVTEIIIIHDFILLWFFFFSIWTCWLKALNIVSSGYNLHAQGENADCANKKYI